MISLVLNKIWASLLFGFTLQVEVAFKRIRNLKTECAVLPPLKSIVAMPVEATNVTKLPFPRMVCKRVVCRKVFPVPTGPSRKKKKTLGEFD